jgi:hypothetical protein
MTGTHPDAIEAWAFDAETFEHLLKRLEPYGRAVILSGDVHYSSGTVMSYWRGNATRPARFAQFTSSGFKNVMPTFITFLDRAAGFAQQLIRLNLGTERLGWDQPLEDMVLLPEGTTEQDLLPIMRSRLGAVPVRLPTWGWLDLNDPERPETFDPLKSSRLNPARPPDWRWRVKPLIDQRPDDERPEPIRLLALDEAEVEAARHRRHQVSEVAAAISARSHACGTPVRSSSREPGRLRLTHRTERSMPSTRSSPRSAIRTNPRPRPEGRTYSPVASLGRNRNRPRGFGGRHQIHRRRPDGREGLSRSSPARRSISSTGSATRWATR